MPFELQFTSWNVRGLNKLVKLKQVMSRIKQLKAKIVFLQETHLTPEDVVKVRRRWPGRVFSASSSSHSRGVITLITTPYLFISSMWMKTDMGDTLLFNVKYSQLG